MVRIFVKRTVYNVSNIFAPVSKNHGSCPNLLSEFRPNIIYISQVWAIAVYCFAICGKIYLFFVIYSGKDKVS